MFSMQIRHDWKSIVQSLRKDLLSVANPPWAPMNNHQIHSSLYLRTGRTVQSESESLPDSDQIQTFGGGRDLDVAVGCEGSAPSLAADFGAAAVI